MGLRWSRGLPGQCWWLAACEGGLGRQAAGLARPVGVATATCVGWAASAALGSPQPSSGERLPVSRSQPAEQVPAWAETEVRAQRLCFQVTASHPVTGVEPAPPRRAASLPGSVSVYGGGHGSRKGQALIPGVRAAGQALVMPLQASGARLSPPLASFLQEAFPDHLTLRLCLPQCLLCRLILLGGFHPAGPHPRSGHSGGSGGRN